MTFLVHPWRFYFVAHEPIYFPRGKSGNILRGAFGSIFRRLTCQPECRGPGSCESRERCAYARLFEPAGGAVGPSGLKDMPRPFVFRAAHLDGRTVNPGERFHFDLNVFDMREPALQYFVPTFMEVATEGLGPRRGKAALESVWQRDIDGHSTTQLYTSEVPRAPLVLPLDIPDTPVRRIEVQFETPTELKWEKRVVSEPNFDVLFARARDRVSTLRAFYGDGPLDLDFRALGERAAAVRMPHCDLRHVAVERHSSRTGQVHSIGGLVGKAEYEGNLTEFVPILRVAQWTGVGRHTVWGKGVIRIKG